jgi:hypothetical protein
VQILEHDNNVALVIGMVISPTDLISRKKRVESNLIDYTEV